MKQPREYASERWTVGPAHESSGVGNNFPSWRHKAPPRGFVKIHVDVGVIQGRGGSAAAVCRDSNGNFLCNSALVIEGLDDPAILEAIACREGIALAEDLNVQNIVIACDSKQVVFDINRGSKGRYGAIVSEIIFNSTHFQCNFVFEGRAISYEAHRLAKRSLLFGLGSHVWLGQPHEQNCIPLSADFE